MLGFCVRNVVSENIPPPALGPRVCIRVFCKTTSIAWNIRCKKNVLGGYCVIFFGKKLILLSCDAYVCIAYIDVPKLKSIGRPFTVENLPWKKRDILLGPCLDNMTAE